MNTYVYSIRGGVNVIGLRIAFVSGGKDSYYAVYRYGHVDIGVLLVYEFPRPSPHILNLDKSVETLLLAGIPVLVIRLTKGREFDEKVCILGKLGIDTIVAGDVYIEEHLNYMEKLAKELGASLVEPLWGYDPVELIYKEFESGIKSLVIGCLGSLDKWLGLEINIQNVNDFIKNAMNVGIDPLGERGEYHTLVIYGPLHKASVTYRIIDRLNYEDYHILKLV